MADKEETKELTVSNKKNQLPSAEILKRQSDREFKANLKEYKQSSYFNENRENQQSSIFDPHTVVSNYYGNLKTADRVYNRDVDCFTLRRVSKKAWIINACILNIQRKIKPYLKPSTNRNLRGYVIHKVGEDVVKAAGKTSPERTNIENFLKNCGLEKDSDRDNFQRYCLKIIRDALEIDQVATEIGYRKDGKPYAFWAVDAATIEKVLPEQDNPYNIKYIQLVDEQPKAYYPEGVLLFDYQNPRSDVRYAFYGYSYVEQAIDLITTNINAFAYNAGVFTENKLPRGMLLVDGNASQETVEEMEDYIYDIMSGSPSNQWRVPIIPAGMGKSGDGANSIKWVQLSGSNQEMQFQQFLDFLISGVLSLFGISADEIGLQLGKSQAIFEHNNSPEIEASKSQILGDTLSFLQQYINQIIEKAFPGYELEFVGYERDDPKQILDLDKGKMESYMTVNEVRKEKGLKPLESEWADKCPANPQLVQMYQAEAAQQGAGMEDPGEMGDTGDYEEDGAGEGEENTPDFGSPDEENNGEENNVDNEAWGDIAETAGDTEEKTEPEETQKSFSSSAKRMTKTIIVNL